MGWCKKKTIEMWNMTWQRIKATKKTPITLEQILDSGWGYIVTIAAILDWPVVPAAKKFDKHRLSMRLTLMYHFSLSHGVSRCGKEHVQRRAWMVQWKCFSFFCLFAYFSCCCFSETEKLEQKEYSKAKIICLYLRSTRKLY